MSSPSPSEPRPPETLTSEALSEVFSALGHPARRQILVILRARGGEMSAGEIADRFRHSWPTTTRHLGVLDRAGLVSVGKRGRQRFYTLNAEPAERAASWIHSWGADGSPGVRPGWAELPYASMRNATVRPVDDAAE